MQGAPSYECQDGGFDPTSKVPEQPEEAKQRTKKEIEELEEAPAERKIAAKEAEIREGPHAEEPNQSGIRPRWDLRLRPLSDLIINQIAVEQENIVTDPLLNAWQDSARNEATRRVPQLCSPPPTSVEASHRTNTRAPSGTLSNQIIGGAHLLPQHAFNFAANDFPTRPSRASVASTWSPTSPRPTR